MEHNDKKTEFNNDTLYRKTYVRKQFVTGEIKKFKDLLDTFVSVLSTDEESNNSIVIRKDDNTIND